MSSPKCDWRVLVAISPPLLGDLLARQLDRDDLEVVVVDGQSARDPRQRRYDFFDVVIVDDLPPPRVRAAAVLRLPGQSGSGSGLLRTSDDWERVVITELATIVGLVNRLCVPRRESTTRPRD